MRSLSPVVLWSLLATVLFLMTTTVEVRHIHGRSRMNQVRLLDNEHSSKERADSAIDNQVAKAKNPDRDESIRDGSDIFGEKDANDLAASVFFFVLAAAVSFVVTSALTPSDVYNLTANPLNVLASKLLSTSAPRHPRDDKLIISMSLILMVLGGVVGFICLFRVFWQLYQKGPVSGDSSETSLEHPPQFEALPPRQFKSKHQKLMPLTAADTPPAMAEVKTLSQQKSKSKSKIKPKSKVMSGRLESAAVQPQPQMGASSMGKLSSMPSANISSAYAQSGVSSMEVQSVVSAQSAFSKVSGGIPSSAVSKMPQSSAVSSKGSSFAGHRSNAGVSSPGRRNR